MITRPLFNTATCLQSEIASFFLSLSRSLACLFCIASIKQIGTIGHITCLFMSIQLASAGSVMESILFSFALLMRFFLNTRRTTEKYEVDFFFFARDFHSLNMSSDVN